jgi:translocation and assembly module TamB
MPFGKGRRKLLLGLVCLLIGSATIWIALPLWFPWVLRPLASRIGARFSAYERLGYRRFSIYDLSVTNQALALHAHRLEGFVPSVWLWKLATEPSASQVPFVRLENWDCQLLSGNGQSVVPYSVIQDVAAVFGTVQRWIPRAAFSSGTLRSGKMVFTISNALWSAGNLQTKLQLPSPATSGMLNVAVIPARPFQLRIGSPSLRLDSTVILSTNQAGLDIRSSTIWQSNRVELQAQFGRSGTLPDTAALDARDFRIPGELVRLPGYSALTGSMSAQWKNGQFVLDLAAMARPGAAQSNLPPIDVEVHAHGDTNSATVQKLVVSLPFLNAKLTDSVSLSFAAPFLHGPVSLDLDADLGQQQWFALTGKLSGRAEINSAPDKLPMARVRLSGSDLGNSSLKAKSFELSANLDWPFLELAGADFRFDDGSTATISGKLDLERNSATDGYFEFSGLLGRRWLPSGYSYENLSMSGTFQGPLQSLEHIGKLEANQVTTPMFQPFALSARWNGTNTTLQHFNLRLSNTKSSLTTDGAVAVDRTQTELRLASLSLATNQTPALELAEPLTIRFAPAKVGADWRLVLTPFHWSGLGGELAAETTLEWPNRGAFQFSLRRFSLELLDGLTQTALPKINVRDLTASARWTNGPAVLYLDFSGTGFAQSFQDAYGSAAIQSVQPQPASTPSAQDISKEILSTPLSFDLKIRGDAHGILLSNLVVNSPTSSVGVIRGFLPVTLNLAEPTNVFRFDSQQPLLLNASIRPEAFFWEKLAALIGVRLQDPFLDLNLSGTWPAPQGQITLRARGIQFKQGKTAQIMMQDLRLALALDRDKARLTEGQVLVQGQRVNLSGELPLGQSSWLGLVRRNLPDWEKATARLSIPEAELAAFEPLFPEILAPEGNFNLDLALLPGARLEGSLNLLHARTRPLGNVAPLREINVALRFRDRTLRLENATATLSGARINLSGQADLRGTNWLNGSLPPFGLELHGTNVPLAREPDFIIRSDLNLAIAKTNDAPPIVSGTAQLRDSFYLSDLSALVPGQVTTPSSRPPYFSIDNPTLADWRLAVTVEGVRWLKVRTSPFNGEVSANLHLQGSLKDPIALGGLKIDSGVVHFPFSSLQLQQGLVSLTSQNPYRPELLVRAGSKQFGYDIHMEVTGSVDAPVIQFTSNPSLSSEQILLMLTAGQMPQGTFTLTPQQRAQTMALFLGGDLLSKLGLRDQTQERFIIRSGEEITELGRPTYHVEYKLSDRWYLVGEYDRFGDFNAGFKWRIYSK